MRNFWKKLLGCIAALGLGGLITQHALEHQGVDPATAAAVGGVVEQHVDAAAERLQADEE